MKIMNHQIEQLKEEIDSNPHTEIVALALALALALSLSLSLSLIL